MKRVRQVLCFVVILLSAWVTGAYADAPGASTTPTGGLAASENLTAASPFTPGLSRTSLPEELLSSSATASWLQVNTNGFGNPLTGEVSALEAFNGYLYAGSVNATNFSQIFRSPDGVTWTAMTQPGFGIAHDIAPPAILDMIAYNGYIYASTGRGDGPGQIWRSVNGQNWAPMVIHGFNDPDVVDITALVEYGGYLYAGATNLVSGAQIFRSMTGNSGSWTQVAPATPDVDTVEITGFAVFGGSLYAAVETTGLAQIWRFDGLIWTTVVSDGFGAGAATFTGGMAEFGGLLYAGAGNAAGGAKLFRTSDGDTWSPVINPGFGGANNQKVDLVAVFGSQLYVSVSNTQTGIEVWQSPDGASWGQVNPDGFGDSSNTNTNWSNAAVNFLSRLYVGTANAPDGGEVWEMRDQTLGPISSTYLPLTRR